MDWYAHYPADYMKHTDHLSMLEDSAYRRLLDSYYAKGKPLSAEPKHLLSICRAFASEEQAAVMSVVDQFFELRGDFYHNDRADKEIEKAGIISEIRKNSGRKGGLAKAKHLPEQKLEQKPKQKLTHRERDISLDPVQDAELVLECRPEFKKLRKADVALVLRNNLDPRTYKHNLEAFLIDAANQDERIKNPTGMLRAYMQKQSTGTIKKEVRGL
jgi:uncharacterized protein YdaU (DUF1376 family)